MTESFEALYLHGWPGFDSSPSCSSGRSLLLGVNRAAADVVLLLAVADEPAPGDCKVLADAKVLLDEAVEAAPVALDDSTDKIVAETVDRANSDRDRPAGEPPNVVAELATPP
ncbi:MAG: hypothetical protein ICV52_18165 [Microcoleus sp. C1-bin4]|nr:hypothetical protein [Microcoleus sp. C1-bin4]